MDHLGPFEHAPVLAIAVSGGADSMALLLMVHAWAQARQGRAVALTVDHGLRRGSAEEARQVAAWCTMRHIEHHTLTWEKKSSPALKDEGNKITQADAREARYQLLVDWCHAQGVLHLLTAHHRDDQAETLCFRLARGSGIEGLAGMAMLSDRQGVRLLRPLLGIPKQALQAYLAKQGQDWIEDASNQTSVYTRNVIRRALRHSPETVLQHAAELMQRLGNIRNILNNKEASYLTKYAFLYPEGYGELHPDMFEHVPPGIALPALGSFITALNGETQPPRSDTLERLYKDLRSNTPKRRSCGRLIFSPYRDGYRVYREAKAVAPALAVCAGQRAQWDKRFLVSHQGSKPTLLVKALGSAGLRQVMESAGKPSRIFPPAFQFLPSFWDLEELVSVPHMQYHHPRISGMECRAVFHPAKPLAGQAFFSMNIDGLC